MIWSVELPGVAGEGAFRLTLDTDKCEAVAEVITHSGESSALWVDPSHLNYVRNAVAAWPLPTLRPIKGDR